MTTTEIIAEKVKGLPPNKFDEVVDFIDFLKERENISIKAERMKKIAEYATENAGTEADFDSDLEAAGVESLLAIDGEKR